jgi:hypothetical protein
LWIVVDVPSESQEYRLARAPLNRSLSEQERTWLGRGLAVLQTGKHRYGDSSRAVDTRRYADQIDGLRVVHQCECGEPTCHTVHFQHFRRGRSIALVDTTTEDGRMLIVLVDEDTDMLAELEVI